MPHLERRGKIQRGELPPHRLGDLAAAVTGVHAPQACRAIEDLTVVIARVVHPFRPCEQAGRGFELTICREGHPVAVEPEAVVSLWGIHDRDPFDSGSWP